MKVGFVSENGRERCAQCGTRRVSPALMTRIVFPDGDDCGFCSLDCARWFLHREILRVGEKISMGVDTRGDRGTIG